jgi:hypothetical protein
MGVAVWIRSRFALLLLALSLPVSGCAMGGMGAAGEGSVAVEVENNLIPPTSLSVYAVPETGARRLIGVVDPSETRTLRFDPVGAAREYRFAAETTSGADIVSNPLVIGANDAVRWDVTANLAVIR